MGRKRSAKTNRDERTDSKALTVEQRESLEAIIREHQPKFTPMGIDVRELLLELAKAVRNLDPLDAGDAGQTSTFPREMVK